MREQVLALRKLIVGDAEGLKLKALKKTESSNFLDARNLALVLADIQKNDDELSKLMAAKDEDKDKSAYAGLISLFKQKDGSYQLSNTETPELVRPQEKFALLKEYKGTGSRTLDFCLHVPDHFVQMSVTYSPSAKNPLQIKIIDTLHDMNTEKPELRKALETAVSEALTDAFGKSTSDTSRVEDILETEFKYDKPSNDQQGKNSTPADHTCGDRTARRLLKKHLPTDKYPDSLNTDSHQTLREAFNALHDSLLEEILEGASTHDSPSSTDLTSTDGDLHTPRSTADGVTPTAGTAADSTAAGTSGAPTAAKSAAPNADKTTSRTVTTTTNASDDTIKKAFKNSAEEVISSLKTLWGDDANKPTVKQATDQSDPDKKLSLEIEFEKKPSFGTQKITLDIMQEIKREPVDSSIPSSKPKTQLVYSCNVTSGSLLPQKEYELLAVQSFKAAQERQKLSTERGKTPPPTTQVALNEIGGPTVTGDTINVSCEGEDKELTAQEVMVFKAYKKAGYETVVYKGNTYDLNEILKEEPARLFEAITPPN